ncbi:MAG TPA: plastocyanin/azurin family copper-binding protein [Actinomycetota bacterium]|nr:plastocyanin/azurin family copper-binding protein [Actinomycetota bacterium]
MGLRKGVAITMGAALAGGLIFAAPTALAGGGGMHCPNAPYYGAAKGRSAAIELDSSCFTPTVLYVEPGTEVTFQNKDPMPHNLSGPVGGFAEGLYKDIKPESEITFTFGDEGVFPYMCYIHPGMSGAIVVGEGRAGEGEIVDIEEVTSDMSGGGGSRPVALDAEPAVSKDGGPGTAPLVLGLGIAVVLLIAAVAALATRKPRTVG